MPRKQRKVGSNESDSNSRSCGGCKRSGCNECERSQRGVIICPPRDRHESFESSWSSESACPDFSGIECDEKKKCKDLSDKCKKPSKPVKEAKVEDDDDDVVEKIINPKEKRVVKTVGAQDYGADSSDSGSDSDSDSSRPDSGDSSSPRCGKRGGGCDRSGGRCGNRRCNGCDWGMRCKDASLSSVLDDFGSSRRSDSACPDFSGIECDQKKKCHKIPHCDKKQPPKAAETKVELRTIAKVEDGTQGAKAAGSSGSSKKGKKFEITFGSKVGHPWESYSPGDHSVHINGKNGPVLHLYRGNTYFFCVKQDAAATEKHALVLTHSPAGGANSTIIPSGFSPLEQGCASFKVEKHTPRYFFYQDTATTLGGGLVIVHDD